jgi:nickel-dependent lactate racemase
MDLGFPYGRDRLRLAVPDDCTVYGSAYPEPSGTPAETVLAAVRQPRRGPGLRQALASRGSGRVVVVVSDATRPVPYRGFLAELLAEVHGAGVHEDEVVLLIATGVHRPTTLPEKREMLGPAAGRYRVEDHDASDDTMLVELPAATRAGATARVDRRYVEAGFRLVTGLVEPHFMAGFSGGAKAICPGLLSLDGVRQFHGYGFLCDPRARNANLDDNPLQDEAWSVARQAPPDFALNVATDGRRRLVAAFAGEAEGAHRAACRFVRRHACRAVRREADVVITSSGGHPLDATFYQCVKGFVSCLPAVRAGGRIIAFGGCSEGIGSRPYEELMLRYSGRWREFLHDIREPFVFTQDQWQLQVHTRALERVGQENLHFVTDGLDAARLERLSVTAHAANGGDMRAAVQGLVDEFCFRDAIVAAIPEGAYCAPVPSDA